MFVHKIQMKEIAERCDVSRAWIEAISNGRYNGPASQEWLERISQTVEQIIEERKSK
jgi:transcriptional regulator with XRE-family HTH domain